MENKWKNRLDDYNSFEGYMPAEAEQRIHAVLFSKNKERKIIPFISHAAAALIGLVLSAIGFYFWNSSTHKIEQSDTIVIHKSDTVYLDTTRKNTAHISETTIITARSSTKERKNTEHSKPDEENIVKHSTTIPITKNSISKLNPTLQNPTSFDNEKEIIASPQNNTVAVHQKTKSRKVISVSDIAPSYESPSFIEKISSPIIAQNKHHQQSPFKFINKYQ